MMSPQIITTNSAPAASRTSRTLTTCPLGRAAQLRIGRERILRLGHADRVVAVAGVLQLLDLRAHLGVGGDVGGAVDLGGDRLHLVPQRQRRPRRRSLKSLGCSHRRTTSLRELDARPRRPRPSGAARITVHAVVRHLARSAAAISRVGVLGAVVDGHDARQAEAVRMLSMCCSRFATPLSSASRFSLAAGPSAPRRRGTSGRAPWPRSPPRRA